MQDKFAFHGGIATGAYVCAESLQSCPALCDAMDCIQPDSSVQEFSRQKYWGGLPCPPLGDLPNPGIKPESPAWQADSSPTEPPGKTR